ncbi:MAG: lysophospholipid acyltransferase family protein [Deltaproteobacteria bacterium]|nr:lysophospholipid acyltransferase family protein [Deltaproteobacteria bacterium]
MQVSRRLASLSLKAAGWEFEGEIPAVRRCVCLAVPHTSNWDGLVLVGIAQSLGIPMSFMIKREWVSGPMGPVMRRLGAVPIDRAGKHNVVEQMIAEFARRDELMLVIPPEGTRKKAPYWKSGFYHIAMGAKVPLVPGYCDFKRKRMGLGPAIPLTGDVRADMDKIRAFYAMQAPTAHDPASVGPIKLREEDAAVS